MQCTYIGNYDEQHNEIKKRRMVGTEIKKALEYIVDNSKSCESYRESEACRLLKIGWLVLNEIK